MKNIPALKSHLQEEWDQLERRGRNSTKRKRKLEESAGSQSTNDKEEDSQPKSGTSSKKVKS